jgi:hypothetical protein
MLGRDMAVSFFKGVLWERIPPDPVESDWVRFARQQAKAGSWVCFFTSRVLPGTTCWAALGSCRKVTIKPRGEAGLGSFFQEHHEPQLPCYTMGLRLPASFLRRCLCS